MHAPDPDPAGWLLRLLDTVPVGALATLHRGEPAASMVPFARDPVRGELVLHLSALAPHTADLLAQPAASLLVTAEPDPDVPPAARPRVSLSGQAHPLARDDPAADAARALYLRRFPDAAVTFELADFGLFVLRPRAARLVAGFGRAHGFSGDRLQAVLATPPAG